MGLEQYLEEPITVLSEEEQTQASVEGHEALFNGRQALDELDHLYAIVSGVQSLKIAVEGIEQVTENDLSMIRSAGDLALTGVGVGHEVLFPSLESVTLGETISTEGLSAAIKKIWETIRRVVASVWTSIANFFRKMRDQTGRLWKQNENMRKRMSNISAKDPQQTQIEITRDAEQLIVNGKYPRDSKAIIDGLRLMSSYGQVVFTDYTDQLIAVGETLVKTINGFDLEKPEESLQAVVRATDGLKLDAINKAMGRVGSNEVNDGRWPDRRVVASNPMPGNKSLFFVGSKANPKEKNVLTLSERSQQRKFMFRNTTSSRQNKPNGSIRIKTIYPSDGIEIYQLNKQILDVVWNYDKQRAKLERIRKSLLKSGDGLQKRTDASGAKIPESTTVYVKEALDYISAYTHWVFNPVADMASQMYATVRASISVCNKSAEVYS